MKKKSKHTIGIDLGDRQHEVWVYSPRLQSIPSLGSAIKRCKDLRAASDAEMDHLLYDSALESLELAADYRRGPRVIPRKFPSFLKARFHHPNVKGYQPELKAVITAANPGGVLTSDDENRARNAALQGELAGQGVLLTDLPVGAADGTHLENSFLISASPKLACALAKKHGQLAYFTITGGISATKDQIVEIHGCNGEGRMILGPLSKLIAPPIDHP